MRLALFQPDIPQNAGTLLRLGACLGVPVEIIEPCGFLFGDRQLRRAGLDYGDLAQMVRYASWDAYIRDRPPGRLILLTTRAAGCYTAFDFESEDTLLLGRETGGVPEMVHLAATERLRVPMRAGMRSLNVAITAAMVLAEALRQTGQLPADAAPDPMRGEI